MNTADHITQDDLILLALQQLPEKESPLALAHLAQCDQCREEVARLQGDLSAYAMTSEMHSPPAYARERLMRQVTKEKKQFYIRQGKSVVQAISSGDGDYELDKPTRWASLMPWAGWAVAAVMALFAVIEFGVHQHTNAELRAEVRQMRTESAKAHDTLETLTDSRAQQVVMNLSSSAGAKHVPEAHAAYMQEKGALVFFASNLDALQPYKTYELWLLPANGRDPIAAGIFKPDAKGNANVVMPNLPKGVPASGFGVTIEDEGGAKQPTLPIVMSGS